MWFVIAGCAIGCASERLDQRAPTDRCLYSCPDGMTCAGTVFLRGHTNPGRCELSPNRCLITADCRPREHCNRPGTGIGVCEPSSLL